MRFLLLLFVVITAVSGCTRRKMECRQEILDTEKAFEQMAAEKGLAEAFSYYVADSGILNAGDSNFLGKREVRRRFERKAYKDVKLSWKPEYVDVSGSCDLAYTWGRYTFTYRDSTGREVADKGIFHTVWKRQADGSWRFVWD